MPDETNTTTNPPIQSETTPAAEPTLQAHASAESSGDAKQEATSPAPIDSTPAETPPPAPQAPNTETTPESTNIPASTPSGEVVTEPVTADENGPIETTSPASAPSSGEAKPATEISTPHQNLEIPNLSEPTSAESYGEARQAGEVKPAAVENSSEAKPAAAEGSGEAKQASEPVPLPAFAPPSPKATEGQSESYSEARTEAELLAAEIAQRKLLKPSSRFMRWLSAKSLAARKLRSQKKSDKIMALFDRHEQITNELVRKNLHFPRQTASEHLELLEKEGKIKQVGNGRNVFYVRV